MKRKDIMVGARVISTCRMNYAGTETYVPEGAIGTITWFDNASLKTVEVKWDWIDLPSSLMPMEHAESSLEKYTEKEYEKMDKPRIYTNEELSQQYKDMNAKLTDIGSQLDAVLKGERIADKSLKKMQFVMREKKPRPVVIVEEKDEKSVELDVLNVLTYRVNNIIINQRLNGMTKSVDLRTLQDTLTYLEGRIAELTVKSGKKAKENPDLMVSDPEDSW